MTREGPVRSPGPSAFVERTTDTPRGAASGLTAALLFGVSTPVAKLLLPGVGPFMMAGLLYLGSGVGLSVLGPALGRREAPLRRSDAPALAAIVAAGGVAAPVLLMLGLARLDGMAASLLLNLEAPFTIGLAVAVFGDSLSGREAAGAFAVVAGGVLLAAPGGALDWAGVAAVAGACLGWAIDNNLSQRLALRDPVALVRVKSLAAGSFNVTLALAAGERLPGPWLLASALATGLVGYGVSIVLHIAAMRALGAARQAALFATAPFAGAIAAVPLLGERLSLREAAAGAAMAAGVATIVRARHGHEHAHEALQHEHVHVHDEHHRHEHAGPADEPHSHVHSHAPLVHDHPHLPDAHHRHGH